MVGGERNGRVQKDLSERRSTKGARGEDVREPRGRESLEGSLEKRARPLSPWLARCQNGATVWEAVAPKQRDHFRVRTRGGRYVGCIFQLLRTLISHCLQLQVCSLLLGPPIRIGAFPSEAEQNPQLRPAGRTSSTRSRRQGSPPRPSFPKLAPHSPSPRLPKRSSLLIVRPG